LSADELVEEDLRVGKGTAGCRVGRNSADRGEGVVCLIGCKLLVLLPDWKLNDELDGADAVRRGDGAAGDDGQFGRERRDRDEPKVGSAGQEFVGAQRRLGVVDVVALGERGVEGRMLEVPHERGGVEEIDGGYAYGI
jgi:hypothetical protein